MFKCAREREKKKSILLCTSANGPLPRGNHYWQLWYSFKDTLCRCQQLCIDILCPFYTNSSILYLLSIGHWLMAWGRPISSEQGLFCNACASENHTIWHLQGFLSQALGQTFYVHLLTSFSPQLMRSILLLSPLCRQRFTETQWHNTQLAIGRGEIWTQVSPMPEVPVIWNGCSKADQILRIWINQNRLQGYS